MIGAPWSRDRGWSGARSRFHRTTMGARETRGAFISGSRFHRRVGCQPSRGIVAEALSNPGQLCVERPTAGRRSTTLRPLPQTYGFRLFLFSVFYFSISRFNNLSRMEDVYIILFQICLNFLKHINTNCVEIVSNKIMQ